MREIVFRGQSYDSNWIFGDVVHDALLNGDIYIQIVVDGKLENVRVKPETVGQYTGKKDIHSRKIFEHDVVQDKYGMRFVVILDEFENRFMGVGFCDAIWNERQGDVRFIRDVSIHEHGLFVVDISFENNEYLEIRKEYVKELNCS